MNAVQHSPCAHSVARLVRKGACVTTDSSIGKRSMDLRALLRDKFTHPLTPSLVDACPSLDLAGERSGQWVIAREEALIWRLLEMQWWQLRLDRPQLLLCRQGRKSLEFWVGDQVMVHREFLVTPEARNRPCDKLRPRWNGSFKVTERITTNAFRLDLPHQLKCHPVFNITAF